MHVTDKDQDDELGLQSGGEPQQQPSTSSEQLPSSSRAAAMSKIQGVRRLKHANSVQGSSGSGGMDALLDYGVEAVADKPLAQYMDQLDLWGVDVFKIDDFTLHRPLTAITYTLLKVCVHARTHTHTCAESRSAENIQTVTANNDHIPDAPRGSLSEQSISQSHTRRRRSPKYTRVVVVTGA